MTKGQLPNFFARKKMPKRLLAELCAWKNMVEGCWLIYVYGGIRLFGKLCAWKNMEEGCWLIYVYGGIRQKVVW
jgi:hypothetical protein